MPLETDWINFHPCGQVDVRLKGSDFQWTFKLRIIIIINNNIIIIIIIISLRSLQHSIFWILPLILPNAKEKQIALTLSVLLLLLLLLFIIIIIIITIIRLKYSEFFL